MQIYPPSGSGDDPGSAASDRPPVRVAVATDTVRAVTLVRVDLHGDVDAPLRVRVRNRLDGPVLPPRVEGVPAAGWDDEGFVGTLPANGTFGVGYACPCVSAGGDSDESEAAVSVELLGPADGEETGSSADVDTAVRDLGRAVPPADVIPTEPVGSGGPLGPDRTDGETRRPEPSIPDPISAWLDRMATRVERAERLTDASAAEAASVLEDCGGPGTVSELPDRLTADLAALRATAARIEELTSRAAAADPTPVATALAEGAETLSDPAETAGTLADRTGSTAEATSR